MYKKMTHTYKPASLLFLCFIMAMFNMACAQAPIRVMTFNIRYDNKGDSLNAWAYRSDKAISQILFHEIALLGIQEALHNQVTDLQKGLPGFAYTGGGRDDGKEKGEYSAIFYDTSKLQMLQSGMFWLSPTPQIPGSKGWDAAITRMVTWALFLHIETGQPFFAFNTHFDHMGKTARRESAKLLLQKTNDIAGNSPVLVTGDFNAVPSDEPIQIITDKQNPLHLINSISLSQTGHYGPAGTFNGFKSSETSEEPIDYVFLKGNWTVLRHATLSQTWQGKFASDHFSVMASVILQP